MRREPVRDRLHDSHAAILAAFTERVRVVESNPLTRSISVQSQLLRDLRVGVLRVDEQKIRFINRRNIERACVREFPINSRVRCKSVMHAMRIIQIVTSQRRVFILLKRVEKSYGAVTSPHTELGDLIALRCKKSKHRQMLCDIAFRFAQT